MIQIPQEIPNKLDFPQVGKLDRQIIRAAVLLCLDNQTAFALYHPELLNEAGKLGEAGKRESRYFWSYGKNRDYREAYEKCVEAYIGATSKHGDVNLTIDDNRKDKALKSLLNQAMNMVEGGADLDADTLKTVTEIFRKLNILKDEAVQMEAPRRYLPETCSSCSYKKFIDDNVRLGNIEVTEDE